MSNVHDVETRIQALAMASANAETTYKHHESLLSRIEDNLGKITVTLSVDGNRIANLETHLPEIWKSLEAMRESISEMRVSVEVMSSKINGGPGKSKVCDEHKETVLDLTKRLGQIEAETNRTLGRRDLVTVVFSTLGSGLAVWAFEFLSKHGSK